MWHPMLLRFSGINVDFMQLVIFLALVVVLSGPRLFSLFLFIINIPDTKSVSGTDTETGNSLLIVVLVVVFHTPSQN